MSDQPPDRDRRSPQPSPPPRRERDEKAWKQERKDGPARGKTPAPTKPPVKITGLREGKQNDGNQ